MKNTEYIKNLLVLVDKFHKLATSQELSKLRDPKYKKFYGSDLWFGQQIAKTNADVELFAIIDNDNIKHIKKLIDDGLLYVENDEIYKYYLEHEKTQETIKFILSSYDKYFGKTRDGYEVYNRLYDFDGLNPLDGDVVSNTPIFLLVHDLIHQVIEPNFIDSLTHQTEKYEDDNEYDSGDEVTILMDEIYEDMASTLSNFQPKQEVGNYKQFWGSFLSRYVYKIFKHYLAQNSNLLALSIKKEEDVDHVLINIINKTFDHLKAELRNKLDKINTDDFSTRFHRKYESAQKASGKVKQLIDGILSKYKIEMLDQVNEVTFKLLNEEKYQNINSYSLSRIATLFDLTNVDIVYQEKLQSEDNLIEQSIASALRQWLIECFKKMKELNNYFKYDLKQELLKEYDEYNEFDEYDDNV